MPDPQANCLCCIATSNPLRTQCFYWPKRDVVQPNQLTAREREILQLLIGEFTHGDIARILEISPLTVETHCRNIRNKLGARNIAGLVRIALIHGLVDWSEEWEDPVSNSYASPNL